MEEVKLNDLTTQAATQRQAGFFFSYICSMNSTRQRDIILKLFDQIKRHIENKDISFKSKLFTILIFRQFANRSNDANTKEQQGKNIFNLLQTHRLYKICVDCVSEISMNIRNHGNSYLKQESQFEYFIALMEMIEYFAQRFPVGKDKIFSAFKIYYNGLLERQVDFPRYYKYFRKNKKEEISSLSVEPTSLTRVNLNTGIYRTGIIIQQFINDISLHQDKLEQRKYIIDAHQIFDSERRRFKKLQKTLYKYQDKDYIKCFEDTMKFIEKQNQYFIQFIDRDSDCDKYVMKMKKLFQKERNNINQKMSIIQTYSHASEANDLNRHSGKSQNSKNNIQQANLMSYQVPSFYYGNEQIKSYKSVDTLPPTSKKQFKTQQQSINLTKINIQTTESIEINKKNSYFSKKTKPYTNKYETQKKKNDVNIQYNESQQCKSKEKNSKNTKNQEQMGEKQVKKKQYFSTNKDKKNNQILGYLSYNNNKKPPNQKSNKQFVIKQNQNNKVINIDSNTSNNTSQKHSLLNKNRSKNDKSRKKYKLKEKKEENENNVNSQKKKIDIVFLSKSEKMRSQQNLSQTKNGQKNSSRTNTEEKSCSPTPRSMHPINRQNRLHDIFLNPPNRMLFNCTYEGIKIRIDSILQKSLRQVSKMQSLLRFKTTNFRTNGTLFLNKHVKISFASSCPICPKTRFNWAFDYVLRIKNNSSQQINNLSFYYPQQQSMQIHAKGTKQQLLPNQEAVQQLALVPINLNCYPIQMVMSYNIHHKTHKQNIFLPSSIIKLAFYRKIAWDENKWKMSQLFRTKLFRLCRHIPPCYLNKWINQLAPLSSYEQFIQQGSIVDYEMFCQVNILHKYNGVLKITIRPNLQVVLQIALQKQSQNAIIYFQIYLQHLQEFLQEVD